jgi:hypothetical protein
MVIEASSSTIIWFLRTVPSQCPTSLARSHTSPLRIRSSSTTPHLDHDATRNALGRLRLQCDSQVARLENSVVARVLESLVSRAVDSQVPRLMDRFGGCSRCGCVSRSRCEAVRNGIFAAYTHEISLPCFTCKGGINRAGLTRVVLGAFQETLPFAGLAFGDSMLNATKGLLLFRWGRMC